MNKKFDFGDYVLQLGEELIHEFNKSKLSTNPVAVGSNKEQSVILKLQNLLPAGVGVGSGFVFDIHGNISNQCDIVIYEKDFCLTPCINNNKRDMFYNCESVIAVGEVKTILTKKEFKDCLKKFSSINSLQRYKSDNNGGVDRTYLSKTSIVHNFENKPIQRSEYDHIFKFVICEKISAGFEDMIEYCQKNVKNKDDMFNTIVSLDGKHIMLVKDNSVCISPYFASDIILQKDDDARTSFMRFMYYLNVFTLNGTTVPLNHEKYYEFSSISINNCKKINFE